jgi:inward rectifier potassium channel
MKPSKFLSPKHFVRTVNVNQFHHNLRKDADLFVYLKRNDLYHILLKLKWWQFLGLITVTYTGINIIFACLYLLTNDGIANAQKNSFLDSFFFSIHTLSTVGYGSMYPQNLAAQIIAAIEIFLGVLLMAILAGIMFARFSRPTARVMFSRVAVICPYHGIPTLMFRAANRRENQIIEAQVRVTFLKNEISPEGQQMRRFYDLNLIRERTPVFALSWLIMHPIDQNSPLWGLSRDDLSNLEAELWVSLTGLDETFSQTIHSRYAYNIEEIIWNHRLVDIFTVREDGSRALDLRKFNQTQPVE